MSYWDRKLKREQLDEKLRGLKESPIANIEFGWIKSIRQALGMSTFQLAKRAGLNQSRISRIENAEVNGDLNLSTLKKIAEALNMRFVYAFVPGEGLEEMVRDRL